MFQLFLGIRLWSHLQESKEGEGKGLKGGDEHITLL